MEKFTSKGLITSFAGKDKGVFGPAMGLYMHLYLTKYNYICRNYSLLCGPLNLNYVSRRYRNRKAARATASSTPEKSMIAVASNSNSNNTVPRASKVPVSENFTTSPKPPAKPLVKSLDTQVTKTKFSLDPIDRQKDLAHYLGTDQKMDINSSSREILRRFCKNSDSVMVENPGTINLWNLITDESKLQAFMTTQLEIEKKKNNPVELILAALMLRIEKFVKQLILIVTFCQIIIPEETIAIAQKMQGVGVSLKKINIIIDSKIRPGLIITFESTIKMINARLVNEEKIVKSCILPLCFAYANSHQQIFDDDQFRLGPDFFSIYSRSTTHPKLNQILNSLAPYGVKEAKNDNYYILRLVLGQKLKLEPNQEGQVQSYLDEINNVFKIYLIPTGTELDLSCLSNSLLTINKPTSVFFHEPLSNNTFAKLINGLNHFMREIWDIAIIRMGQLAAVVIQLQQEKQKSTNNDQGKDNAKLSDPSHNENTK